MIQWKIGEVRRCKSCDKTLVLEDSVSVYIESAVIKLPAFCLSCKYHLPFIHHVACTICSSPEACYNDCSENQILEQNFSSVTYQGEIQEWIRAFKFDGNIEMGVALSPLLTLAISRFMNATDQVFPSIWGKIRGLLSYRETGICCNIVTSVPISTQRLLERGFNQADLLARQVAKSINAPYIMLLHRQNDVEHSSHLSKLKREEAVKHAFTAHMLKIDYLNRSIEARGRVKVNIIIVDDIYTTGSTLKACASVIKQYLTFHCHIYSLTLARA